MSYLSNRNNEDGERVVLDRLTKATGLEAYQTPTSHKFDFALEDKMNWRIVGEIKIREKYFPDSWFVSDKKRMMLEQVSDAIGVTPWFVIHCMVNDTIYTIDLSAPYKFEPKVMINKWSETNKKQWGRNIYMEHWNELPSTSVDGGKLTTK